MQGGLAWQHPVERPGPQALATAQLQSPCHARNQTEVYAPQRHLGYALAVVAVLLAPQEPRNLELHALPAPCPLAAVGAPLLLAISLAISPAAACASTPTAPTSPWRSVCLARPPPGTVTASPTQASPRCYVASPPPSLPHLPFCLTSLSASSPTLPHLPQARPYPRAIRTVRLAPIS